MKNIITPMLLASITLLPVFASAQSPWDNLSKRPSTLGIEQGTATYNAGPFQLKLLKASQTVASLQSVTDTTFDFIPVKFFKQRSSNGFYQFGDLNLRIKQEDGDWIRYSSASNRAPVLPLKVSKPILAAADLAPTFPADMPVSITRQWAQDDSGLLLSFTIKNKSAKTIELGSVGVPMIFNNILDGESLDEAHANNVFYDPYIGNSAGYLQLTRLSGKGPELLVTPLYQNKFEAYSPLLDDPTPRSTTFEGFYEWMPLSKAHALTDWKDAEPWNAPTSVLLKAGQQLTYTFKLLLAPNVKAIEKTLIAHDRPVAVGVPGYVIPQDVVAKLFVNYRYEVLKTEVFPKDALTIKRLPALKNGTKVFQVTGNKWGRARLTLDYGHGFTQTVHYKVIKPETEVVADFGKFLTTKQWFDDAQDPFKRAPSVISYDYETGKQVTQDSRAWIAGLSDEGGAGSWLGAIMKQLVQPDANEVAKMQQFVDQTIWGKLQYATDSNKYGVKKSLFYYEPKLMPEGTYSSNVNFKGWAAWPLKEANSVGRSYNYPHVAAAHWVLYRLARNYTGLVTSKPGKWYLENAYYTGIAMVKLAPEYAQFGQMEGSVFLYILKDLKAEGLVEMAASLETEMKKRADHWNTLNYPFGSEMAWDSTGQEEVYLWSDYFGYHNKAAVTLNAILGYMPTVPHWGYNGSARRYWDFLYGGKLSRVERQLHHYGSGLNAIPVLEEYRKNPADLYLLRVGYGGLMGSISNITQDGFGPAAFHSFPSTLKIDGLSGDYGPNFYGYAVNSATYLINDPEYGWLSFGGNLTESSGKINVELTTAAKSKVYIAPLKLWITLDAGQVKSVSFNPKNNMVSLSLMPGTVNTSMAYIHVNYGANKYEPATVYAKTRGAYVVPLSNGITSLNLIPVK